MNRIILPGAVIGVLGSGQLGRMFAIAARQMGYRVHTFSPDDDTPTGQIADREVQAEFHDLEAVAAFARSVDVMTFEFEKVPVAAANVAARYVAVHPAGCVLHTTQNRLREKRFLRQIGVPTTQFQPIESEIDLDVALTHCEFPAVLKTAEWGYDGKGQVRIAAPAEGPAAWEQLGRAPAILEQWVDFAAEISVIGARGSDDQTVVYEPFENVHSNHILDQTRCPAAIERCVADAAMEITRIILREFEVVGVLCVEFFVTGEGTVLVNEIAPRPHNSGHLTIDAHVISQFEQQVRAVCGLPLGSPQQLQPAAMVNLLGDLWDHHTPQWRAACSFPNVKLHLYGKAEPRPARKMGHLTALGETSSAAAELALLARSALNPCLPARA